MERREAEFVNVRTEAQISTVSLNRQPLNVLNRQLRLEIAQVFRDLATRNETDVVIVTGNSKTFSAGWDLNECLDLNPRKAFEITVEAHKAFNVVDDFEKPVIAAISGWCLGGGIELAMACDIRIAAIDSKIGEPGPNIGIFPNFGGTQRLLRLVGPDKAKELILTEKTLSGKEAEKIGLVNKVVPENEVMEEAVRMAREMVDGKSQTAVRAALKAIQSGYGLSLSEGLTVEAEIFAEICSTRDMHEGINAFLEKRKPEYVKV
jgi:enoyl-CoA hydratase/carnithine racemase